MTGGKVNVGLTKELAVGKNCPIGISRNIEKCSEEFMEVNLWY